MTGNFQSPKVFKLLESRGSCPVRNIFLTGLAKIAAFCYIKPIEIGFKTISYNINFCFGISTLWSSCFMQNSHFISHLDLSDSAKTAFLSGVAGYGKLTQLENIF